MALLVEITTADDFITLVKKIIIDGIPKLIVADKYTAINSGIFKRFLQSMNISIMYTPTDHPQSNGMIEKAQSTVIGLLKCKHIERPKQAWTTLAIESIKSYNETIHSSTKFPPVYLLKGEDPQNHYKGQDLHQNRAYAKVNSDKSHEYSENYFKKKNQKMEFTVGDKVLVKTSKKICKKKLDPDYSGPFYIKQKISSNMYQLEGFKDLIHVSALKKCFI
ncbi:Transposon Tf2-9 polyprotein [Sarcoptes scabiei]|nr:Transposon Tf2-9 polyprotein [Sarcoptes scabiei]